jgi:hypothetical protein
MVGKRRSGDSIVEYSSIIGDIMELYYGGGDGQLGLGGQLTSICSTFYTS